MRLALAFALLMACGPTGPDQPLPDAGTDSNDPNPKAPAASAAACGDGKGPAVPAGFPALGTGCRSHFTYHWYYELFGSSGDADEADARGVRRIEDMPFTGTYDLGTQSASDDYHPVVMFLPSLTPGFYRGAEGGGIGHVLTSSFGTDLKNGKTGMLIEIVGSNAEAVWGRFVARACELSGSSKTCYHFEQGRFSAARDSARSDFEFGYPLGKGSMLELCETRADCPQHGNLPPLCQSGVCTGPAPGPM